MGAWLGLGGLAGCAPQPLDLGPALFSVYLGSQTDLADLLSLRIDSWSVWMTDLRFGSPVDELPIDDAALRVAFGGSRIALETSGGGLYGALSLGNAALSVPPGTWATVEAIEQGRFVSSSAQIPQVLRLEEEPGPVEAGEPLVVSLPGGWQGDYDHVLASLVTEQGVVWSNHPSTLRGWLELASGPSEVTDLVVPTEVLAPGTEGALAVHFLRQLDREVIFTGPVNQPVSTFLAGTAWLVPVEVL